jgi:hypothetical protein
VPVVVASIFAVTLAATKRFGLIGYLGYYAAVAIPYETGALQSGNTFWGSHKPLGQPRALCSQDSGMVCG